MGLSLTCGSIAPVTARTVAGKGAREEEDGNWDQFLRDAPDVKEMVRLCRK